MQKKKLKDESLMTLLNAPKVMQRKGRMLIKRLFILKGLKVNKCKNNQKIKGKKN